MNKSKKIIAILYLAISIALIFEIQRLNKQVSNSGFLPMRQLDLKLKKEKVCSKISDDFYNYSISDEDIILYIDKYNETKVSNLIDMIENDNFSKNKFFNEYLLKLDNFRVFLALFIICFVTIIISSICFFQCFCIINTECSQSCCECIKNSFCKRDPPKTQIKCCCYSIIFWCIIPLILIAVIINKYDQKEEILSNVECSLFKFIEEIYEGEEPEKNVTKWLGIEAVQQKMNEIAIEINEFNNDINILTNLDNIANNISQRKENFENKFISRSNDIYSDNNYYFNKISGNFKLDLANEFYLYRESLFFSPDNSIIGKWYKEYDHITNIASNNIRNAFYYFEILNKTSNINSLFNASNNLLIMKDSLLPLKNEIHEILFGNLININKSILLGINFTQISSIAFISIFIIYWILLIIFFGKDYDDEEKNQKMVNAFAYIFYVLCIILSILSLLMICVGYTLLIVGDIGNDFYKSISYLVNITNYNSTIFGNSSNILNICINGNGDISKEIGLSYENSYIFDELKKIEKALLEIEQNITEIKSNTYTYNEYKGILSKRANYEDIDFGIIKNNERIILKNLLQDLNDKTLILNEEWNFTNTDSISCAPYTSHSNKLYFNPKTCNPYSRYESIPDLEEVSKYISEIIRMQNYANGNNNNNSIRIVLDELKEKYLDYLDEISKGLPLYINAIQNFTNITKDIIGENSKYFEFLNCSFIGINTKIILKTLRMNVGKKFPNKSVGLIFAALFFIFIMCLVHYIFSPIRIFIKYREYVDNLKKLIIVRYLLELINILN